MISTAMTRDPSPRGRWSTRVGVLALFALLTGTVGACASAESDEPTGQEASEASVPDLTGLWETTSGSFDQQAVIAGSTITINWVPDDGSDPMLYWAGSFEAPASDGKHTWASSNDHSQTDSALLASGDETKDFTYEDGAISYEVSALGETDTVTLEQTSSTIPGGTDIEEAAPEPAGSAEVIETGMGVDNGYAWVTAMVQHEGLTGEYATVLFNVYDKNDDLIASEEQVEELGTAGTTFPIGTQVEIPSGAKASRVEADVNVSDYGSNVEAMPVVDPVKASASKPNFHLENSTGEDWADPRVAIVCRDDAGEIAGGGVDFPSSVPAGGEFLVSDAHLITRDDATECEAYVQLTPEL